MADEVQISAVATMNSSAFS